MPRPLLLLLPAHAAMVAATCVRARRHGRARAAGRGLIDALRGLPSIWETRRAVQAKRRASVAEIAAAMVWNPAKLRRRAVVLRPFRPRGQKADGHCGLRRGGMRPP